MPSILPYLSLFTVETYNYFHKILPGYAFSLSDQFQGIVKSSRMRIKLLDDSRKGIDGTFELLDWISDFHQEWHIRKHTGLFAPLKRMLQDDLGMFFYNGHIIGSTHTGILNTGYEKGDLPGNSAVISSYLQTLSFSLGKELGTYLATIISLPEFALNSTRVSTFNYAIDDAKLKYSDMKSEKILNSIFNGGASELINFSLLFLLAEINFLRFVFNDLIQESIYTHFKIKYIVLYHLAFNVQKLQDRFYRDGIFSAHSKKQIQAIVKDKELKQLLSQSKFRNILIHYAIEGLSPNNLSTKLELFGLVEYYFNGQSYVEVLGKIDRQIERISIILEEWLNWKVRQSNLHDWW